MLMVKKVTAFSISEDVLEHIDQMRGLASRSAVVEDILKKNMQNLEVVKEKVT